MSETEFELTKEPCEAHIDIYSDNGKKWEGALGATASGFLFPDYPLHGKQKYIRTVTDGKVTFERAE